MPKYVSSEKVFVGGAVVPEGVEFTSDAVPGRTWQPRDKDAKAAVRARDEARKTADVVALKAGSGEPDPRIAELEARLKEAEDLAKLRDDEIAQLTERVQTAEAALAKFDGDGDGKPGGSKPA